MLRCTLSGEIPRSPVISRKSGHVYERSLILKQIETEGKCPITGIDLSEEDLVSLNVEGATKPRLTTTTSVPGMLALFQNEWDALMLETFTLKKHLDTTRRELSQALYQHDAACRVIARLVRERDEALQALAAVRAGGEKSDASSSSAVASKVEAGDTDAMDVANESNAEGSSLPTKIVNEIVEMSKTLSKGRKKRSKPATFTKKDAIKTYANASKHSVRGAKFQCVDMHPDQSILVLGETNGCVRLYDCAKKRSGGKLKGHKKAVRRVLFDRSRSDRDFFYTCSSDATVRLWSRSCASENYKTLTTIESNTDEVSDASVHATGKYLATACKDGSWSIHDVSDTNGVKLSWKSDANENEGANAISFHPDGVLVGCGFSSNKLRLFDLKGTLTQAAASLDCGAVSSLAFSENGYFMVTGGDSVVKLWDLRKPDMMVRSEELDESASVEQVVFDGTGTYLSIVSDCNVRVKHTKSWSDLSSFQGAKKGNASGAVFGNDAAFLASCGHDGSIIFSAPQG
eukprot:g4447.t1